MKYLYVTFFAVVGYLKGFCTSNVVIAFNLKDCINCMRALSSFEELKGVCDVSFVLPEQYRVDSALIVEKYRLHELGSSVSFSDDLFREYSYKGASSATIESNYKTAQYCINLMNLDEQFIDYLKQSVKKVDTLFSGQQYLARGVDRLIFDGAKMLCFANYKREGVVYDLIRQEPLYTITLTDTLLKTIYGKSRGSAADYEKQQEWMIAERVPERFSVEDISFYKDTVFLFTTSRYFEQGELDLMLMPSFSITRFYKGKYISTEMVKLHEYMDDKLYNNIFQFFHYFNGIHYQSMGPEEALSNRYFLAKYKYAPDGALKFQSMYPARTPDMYGNFYSCSFPAYYRNYAVLPMVGTIYCLDDPSKNFELSYFTKDNTVTASQCNHSMYIYSFVVSDNYVWLIQDNKLSNGQYLIQFVKYDRRSQEATIAPMALESGGNTLVAFDPIDPDYIILEWGKGHIIRRKVF
jgi:hypothetical protein